MVNKIAIVTLYDNINIGNKLQNYALQEILSNYAKEVVTLTYSEARKITPLIGWKGRIVLKLSFPKGVAIEKRAIIERYKRFKEFSTKYLNTSEERKFKDYDITFNDDFDFFVCGSDQVWHNFSNSADEINYFFLSFVEEKKRICFAPSFGFDIIPENFKSYYLKGFAGFKTLSCREKKGCKMINELTGREVILLPDPTLCINKEEWSKIELEPQYKIPKRFILVYFLGEKSEEIINQIQKYIEKYDLPLIDIFNKNELKYYTTRPDEFLYLVRRAEFILTNSFHGCIFSIINNKKFGLFNRIDNDGIKMNSRFDTLFNELDVKLGCDGLYETSDKTNANLENMKNRAEEYLKRSFADQK